LVVPACLSKPTLSSGDAGSQHDEDLDGIPDDRDPCPHLSTAQVDSDHDGIGDDCDIDQNSPGETVRFFTFETGVTGLVTEGTSSQQVADTLDLDATGGTPSALYAADSFASARVDVGFEVLGVSGSTNELGVLTSHPPSAAVGNDDGDTCYATRSGSSQIYLRVFEDQALVNGMTLGNAMFDGIAGRVRVDHSSAMFSCTLDQLSPPHTPATVTMSPSKGAGRAGVVVRGASIRLTYLYIVGR
jgi:hypothetical protein